MQKTLAELSPTMRCMATRDRTVTVAVTKGEKEKIVRAAQEQDKTTSEYVRSVALEQADSIKTDTVREEPEERLISAFAENHLTSDPNSVVSKGRVYAAFEDFCRKRGATPPTQRMLSRRLRESHSIDSGRHYLDNGRKRCYENVALVGQI